MILSTPDHLKVKSHLHSPWWLCCCSFNDTRSHGVWCVFVGSFFFFFKPPPFLIHMVSVFHPLRFQNYHRLLVITAAACVFKGARDRDMQPLYSIQLNRVPFWSPTGVGTFNYSHDTQTWPYLWSNHCLHRWEMSSSSAVMIQLVCPRLCLFLFLLSSLITALFFSCSWVSSFLLALFQALFPSLIENILIRLW